jgi:hypothetical protein
MKRNASRKFHVEYWYSKIIIAYCLCWFSKTNSDWLLEAMPLKIWLPIIPIINRFVIKWNLGTLCFSWTGAIYDLGIVLLLLYKRTRLFGFILVVVFHVLTKILFPIGCSLVMIISSLIFFDASFHKIVYFGKMFYIPLVLFENGKEKHNTSTPI